MQTESASTPAASTPTGAGTIWPRLRLAALALLVLGAAGLAVAGRQPWYDEFYSFYVVRPGVPVGDLAAAWLRDNHPPTFYALAWLWARLIVPSGLGGVEALRTLNLALLAVGAGALAWRARGDAWLRGLIWPYCLALAATLAMVDRIDQLRSYFLSFVLVALVAPMLAGVARGQRSGWALGIALMLALSVHVVTTLIVLGLTGGIVALLLARRRWREAARLSGIAGLGSVPFAVFMAVQLRTIVDNTQSFWIPGGPSAARWAIEQEWVDATLGNPALAIAALIGFARLASRRSDTPERRAKKWEPVFCKNDAAANAYGIARDSQITHDAIGVIGAMLGGLALALAVLIAVHLHRPIIIARYLVALDPVLALIVAMGASEALRRIPAHDNLAWARIAIDLILLTGAAWALRTNLAITLARPGWDGTARVIAARVAACPQTRVMPALRWNAMTLGMMPVDNRAVVPFAYRLVAARWHITLTGPDAPCIDRPGACPRLFWAEHVAGQHPTADAIIRGLNTDGLGVGAGRVERIGDGWVFAEDQPASRAISRQPMSRRQNPSAKSSASTAR